MLLHEAARRNDIVRVNELIADSVDVNATYGGGKTALYEAVVGNNIEVVKILLQAKANITNDCNMYRPLLHIAADRGNNILLEILIENKADVNIKTHLQSGDTPLHVAIRNGQTSCVPLLLRAGANPNICDNYLVSPLLCAIRHHQKSTAKLLLEASANTNFTSPNLPKWAKDMFDQRRHVKRALTTFLGVMKYRFRLKCEATQIIGYRYPRDMTRKISGEIWNTRMDDRWHPVVMKRVKVCDHKCKNKEMCRHLCCKK